MNEIEKMIESLCPDGVEFRELRDICTPLRKATLKVSELLEDGEYPVINSGRNLYGYYNKYNNEGNALIVAARGEYAGFINYIDTKFWAGGLCYPYRSRDEKMLLTKFVYYILKVNEIDIMEKLVSRGSIPALNKSDLDLFKVPVPPLEIQQKIVKVLDIFTELEATLEATLEAELSLRKKQYEYYRNKLLTFDNITDRGGYGSNPIWRRLAELCPQGVPMVALGEVGTFIRGSGLQKKDFVENGVGCIHYGQIYTHYGIFTQTTKSFVSEKLADKLKKVSKNDLIIATTSENIDDICKAVVWLGDDDIVTGGHASIFKHAQNPKYLAYYFQTKMFFTEKKKYVTGTKVMDISTKKLEKIIIPLPPLEIQQMIVEILGKFDRLVNDLTKGLPAEINARRQQYEYYRNTLLTFKER